MAVVTVSGSSRSLSDEAEVSAFLAEHGIWYRHFVDIARIGDDASAEEVLAAFAEPIREQMRRGGYVHADVVELGPTTSGLEAMLARFSSEHWHSEDEVRFIVRGRGIFHVRPRDGRDVFRIEVREGDMINVPRGTWHWFDLCDERRIRAIRLFQDTSGWTPQYTGSGEERRHEPVCMGPGFIRPVDPEERS